jgi:excisionase family DNA binding protein
VSSNLRIVKICAYCKQEFIARKTTTETCSDPCAKRFYKVKQRDKAIQRAELETVVKREPKAFITEGEIKAVQAKEWLTLKEAALLLNVSPLTLRRWTLAGKVRSTKVGKKHTFTPQYKTNRFKFENGALYEANNEDGYNEYKRCSI